MPSSNEAVIAISAKVDQALRGLNEISSATDRMEQKMGKAGKASNKLFDASKIKGAAVAITGVTGTVVALMKSINIANNELNKLVDRRKMLADSNFSRGELERQLGVLLPNEPGELTSGQVIQQLTGQSGLSGNKALIAARAAFNARSTIPRQQAVNAVIAASRLDPSRSGQEIGQLAEAVVVGQQDLGLTAEQALGLAVSGSSIAATKSVGDFGQRLIPATAFVNELGGGKNDVRKLTAETIAFNILSRDREGRISASTLRNLQTRLSDKARPFIGDTDLQARNEFLRNDPRGRQIINEFLSDQSKIPGESQGQLAAVQYLETLRDPRIQNRFARERDAALQKIPQLRDLPAAFEAKLKELRNLPSGDIFQMRVQGDATTEALRTGQSVEAFSGEAVRQAEQLIESVPGFGLKKGAVTKFFQARQATIDDKQEVLDALRLFYDTRAGDFRPPRRQGVPSSAPFNERFDTSSMTTREVENSKLIVEQLDRLNNLMEKQNEMFAAGHARVGVTVEADLGERRGPPAQELFEGSGRVFDSGFGGRRGF